MSIGDDALTKAYDNEFLIEKLQEQLDQQENFIHKLEEELQRLRELLKI